MVSLYSIVKAAARELDDLAEYAVASATTSSVTVTRLVDGATGAATTQHDGAYLYNQVSFGASAGQQVQARPGGFTPASGTIAIDPAWSAPTAATDLLATHLFPVLPFVGAQTDYRTLVRRGLSRLAIPDRIAVTITTSDSLALTTWAAWLDRPERLVRVLEPGPTGGRAIDASWRRPRLVLDGETPTLELDVPFASGTSGSLTLDVLRPADTWVKGAVSGTWAESTTGPTLDNDEVKVALNDAVAVTLLEAMFVLMTRSNSRPTGDWAAKYTDQLALCRSLRFWDRTQEIATAPAAVTEAA